MWVSVLCCCSCDKTGWTWATVCYRRTGRVTERWLQELQAPRLAIPSYVPSLHLRLQPVMAAAIADHLGSRAAW